ncbi:MAG: AAA family ATPase [Planctomycetota bacterium]
MVINRIAHLRHPGVFRDFTWLVDLPDFGRYNLIYGWNGSGKSTISRMFQALEAHVAPASGEVTFTIKGRNVRGDEFPHQTTNVRVFNRDFMRDSVFPLDGSDVPPIFIVGKESVEKQKEVEKLKKKLADAEAALPSQQSKKRDAEKTFDKHCIDRATVIRDTLRSSGSNPYNNYDKASYRSRAQKMAKAGDTALHLLSESDREKLLAQHRATPKPKVQQISYQAPDLQRQADAISRLLEETVVSEAIKALRDDPALSSWVHQGLGLHQARQADRCLFCEQPILSGRLAALEDHFSAEYETFLTRLNAKIAELEAASKAAANVSFPNRAEFYDDLGDEYEKERIAFREVLNTGKGTLDALSDALRDKKARAFESIGLTVNVPNVDFQGLARLNIIVRKHNEACDSFQTRATEARKCLEADSVAATLDDFNNMVVAVKGAQKSFDQAEAETKLLKTEIERIEREIVEHRQPAEELNEDLRKYLGHDELRLDVKDTGYTITRNGVPATALSEGETTAIALLYFLKSLRDRRFDLANGVAILDDPVSSLDANALYLAFGFIRERTKDAAQLFILTHNFAFFRQVRNWFHHLKGQNKNDVSKRPSRFYMLECAREGDQRCSSIRPLDPLLEQYESEYHYLFARIYRAATSSRPKALEESYIFPNMARRLLEAFLAFRQPHLSGELWQKLKDVEFDETKKLRILRFLHTHSHGDVIGEPEHDPSLLGEADSVLKNLLEFIKDQDPKHCEAMVRLVDPPAEEGDDK